MSSTIIIRKFSVLDSSMFGATPRSPAATAVSFTIAHRWYDSVCARPDNSRQFNLRQSRETRREPSALSHELSSQSAPNTQPQSPKAQKPLNPHSTPQNRKPNDPKRLNLNSSKPSTLPLRSAELLCAEIDLAAAEAARLEAGFHLGALP